MLSRLLCASFKVSSFRENSLRILKQVDFFRWKNGPIKLDLEDAFKRLPKKSNKTRDFMFMGINMFWALLKFILAQAAGQVWKGF